MTRSRWTPAVLWGFLIEILTTWPQPPTFGAPAGTDKVVHVVMYGIFGYLVARALGESRPAAGPAFLAVAALFVWAALDEWHQVLVPGRTASVTDWVADAVGVCLGVGARLASVRPARAAR